MADAPAALKLVTSTPPGGEAHAVLPDVPAGRRVVIRLEPEHAAQGTSDQSDRIIIHSGGSAPGHGLLRIVGEARGSSRTLAEWDEYDKWLRAESPTIKTPDALRLAEAEVAL